MCVALGRLYTLGAHKMTGHMPLFAMRASRGVAIRAAELKLVDVQLTTVRTFLVALC
jgi:hypothetical protein